MKRGTALLLAVVWLVSACACGTDPYDPEGVVRQSAEVVSTGQRRVDTEDQTILVYVTDTGSKYHAEGCQYLSQSCIPMDLEEAQKSYEPCSKCHPPK